METPSSTRRITRSQAIALSASSNSNLPISRKFEESEKNMPKSRQKSAEKNLKDRSALIDITNDSPIVGLAMGNLETPSSALSKKRISNRAKHTRTPGSGEALLRGQVKILLQKVEEEAEFSKITFEKRTFFNLQGLVSPAISLVAPTPANTPQILNFSDNGDLPSNETFVIPQVVTEQDIESDSLITRSLLLDFSEKSQTSDSSGSSSTLTYEGGDSEISRGKLSTDDDCASIWSMQVNASSTKNEEEFEDYIEQESEYKDYGELLDDLCEGMSKISVTKFTRKHIRFLYNIDGEIEGEEEVSGVAVSE